MPEDASPRLRTQKGGKAAVWRGDMADVARTCGDDVARELCDKLPGIDLYVPSKLTGKDHLLNRIDRAIAERLMAGLGGGEVRIPAKRRSWRETFELVEALVDQGLTTQQIALQLGITQSYVFRVRHKAGAIKISRKPDPRQQSIFHLLDEDDSR